MSWLVHSACCQSKVLIRRWLRAGMRGAQSSSPQSMQTPDGGKLHMCASWLLVRLAPMLQQFAAAPRGADGAPTESAEQE